MINFKNCLLLLVVMIDLNYLAAQESVNASGGDASGGGGTCAYSIGQIVCTTNSASVGSVAMGVQQPYEISVLTSINQSSLNFEIIVFPNPATDFLNLKIENAELLDFDFKLFDVNGRLVESRGVNVDNEVVDMHCLPSSTYFLKVFKRDLEVKNFKIIKY